MRWLEWFLHTIEYSDREVLQHLDHASIAFQRPGLLWLGLFLALPTAWFFYDRQRRNLGLGSPRLLAGLTITRVIIFLLLVLTLAGPFLKLDHQIERRPVLAVVVDQSESMDLPIGRWGTEQESLAIAQSVGLIEPGEAFTVESRATFSQLSRRDLVQKAFDHAQGHLKELAERFDLRVFVVGRELVQLESELESESERFKISIPEGLQRTETHLGDAVAQIVEDAAGRKLSGIVVLTDGQNTGGRAPIDTARESAKSRAPLFPIPAGGTSRLQDVAVVDVFTSGQISVGDKAQVSITIESTGFDGRGVDVQLLDGSTVLATRRLVLNGGEQQRVELSFEAKESGMRSLSVAIPIQPEEILPLQANNSEITQIEVSEEKIRVLLIDGSPRWDFRFLKNAMRRDSGLAGRTKKEVDVIVDTEVIRIGPGNAGWQKYPQSLDDLLEYHTIILGDIHPDRLPTGFLVLLREAVEQRGLGLILAAGPKANPHRFDKQFQELLPVQLMDSTDGLTAPVYNPYRLETTSEGVTSTLLRLGDDAGQDQEIWRRMPAYYWAAGVERAAPAAFVLAVNPRVENGFGKMPLIAWHFFGTGRVLFVGTDSTWLWRQNAGDRYYYTFWGQAVRFVARRETGSEERDRLQLQPVRIKPGDRTQIELIAHNADKSPMTEPTVQVEVIDQTGGVIGKALAADPRRPGRYVGSLTGGEPGDYVVRYSSLTETPFVEATLKVLASTAEFRFPNVNRPALEGLASASGGEMLELTALASLSSRLKGEPTSVRLNREKTLWDNWLMLVLVVGVYAIDVAIRRLSGLT